MVPASKASLGLRKKRFPPPLTAENAAPTAREVTRKNAKPLRFVRPRIPAVAPATRAVAVEER